MKASLGLACLAAVLVAACGGAEQGSGTPESTANSASAAASSAGKVVPHETLLTFLPAVPGLTKAEPRGDTDATEGVSRVQVNYEMKDTGGLSVEIMDTLRNQAMLEPLQAMVRAGHSENRDGTSITATTIAGSPAYEEWTAEARNGTVGILVEGRFTVVVNGKSVQEIGVLRRVAEAIDLKKLAALK